MLHVYGRHHTETERMRRLIQSKYNLGSLDDNNKRSFDKQTESAVLQCRTDGIQFLFPSSFSGIERPQIEVLGTADLAWGEFAYDDTYSFKEGHELPIRYIHPLEDETLKYLIDAGLYSDNRFEELMGKLMKDEAFDIESELTYQHINIGSDAEPRPVVMVDPVHTVDLDNTKEQVTINELVKHSARLVIELRKEGVSTEDVVSVAPTVEEEHYIEDEFEDVISTEKEELEHDASDNISTTSELLDAEIDVTEKLQGGMTFDETSEDDLIRDLKTRDKDSFETKPKPAKKSVTKPSKPEYQEKERKLDFDGGLDDIKKQLEEDDGPEF